MTRNSPGEISISTSTAQAGMSSAASASAAGGAGEEGAAAAAQPQQEGPVVTCKGVNGLDKVVLREVRGSSAEVYLYGGHVTSWKDEHGEELLFVSNKVILFPIFSMGNWAHLSASKILPSLFWLYHKPV